jgi:NitT/TauT family transport system substrate-binding protein
MWLSTGEIVVASSPACLLAGVKQYEAAGKKVKVAYLYDKALGIKVVADKAFYAMDASNPKAPLAVPFLLKKDAEAYAAKTNARLATYAEALGQATATVVASGTASTK